MCESVATLPQAPLPKSRDELLTATTSLAGYVGLAVEENSTKWSIKQVRVEVEAPTLAKLKVGAGLIINRISSAMNGLQ